jgi:tetratricopeptide (TPR) repeat protein
MTDVSAETDPIPGRRRAGLNLWLNLVLALLVIAMLGAAAWFGYSVYRDKQSNIATTAAGRLAALLQEQVRTNPNDVVLRVRLGEALGGMGKYADATEQLNQALKIDPKHIGAHLDLGLVALAAKDPGSAESYFKKVLDLTEGGQYAALDQSRETALYNLGLLSMDKKQYADAAGFFKAALVIRKDSSDTYYQLAKALEGMGEIDGAIQQLEIGINFDPGFAEAHYFLGQLYKKKGDDVNASYEFVRAMELAPDGDPPREAVEAFGPASKWVAKARTDLAGGNLEGALTSVLVARNLDKKSFEAAKLHAEILLKRGALKDALDVYRQAAVLDEKNAEVKAQIAALEPQVAAILKKDAANAKPKK